MSIIKNRVTCINKVHAYLNEAVPVIQADIEANGLQCKTDNSLYKKSEDRLKAILPDFDGLQVFFKTSEHSKDSLQLFVKGSYVASEPDTQGFSTWQYYERTVYLRAVEWVAQPLHDLNSMEAEHKRANKMMVQARDLQSQARAIHHVTSGR